MSITETCYYFAARKEKKKKKADSVLTYVFQKMLATQFFFLYFFKNISFSYKWNFKINIQDSNN